MLTQIGFFSFEFLAQLLSHLQFDLAVERLVERELIRTFGTRDFLIHILISHLVRNDVGVQDSVITSGLIEGFEDYAVVE